MVTSIAKRSLQMYESEPRPPRFLSTAWMRCCCHADHPYGMNEVTELVPLQHWGQAAPHRTGLQWPVLRTVSSSLFLKGNCPALRTRHTAGIQEKPIRPTSQTALQVGFILLAE